MPIQLTKTFPSYVEQATLAFDMMVDGDTPMPNVHLRVLLSAKREQSGILVVQDRSGKTVAQFEALGRGNQGGGDTQMLIDGNTPTGTYRASSVSSTESWNQISYGPNGAITLEPLSGNAIAAEQNAGRKGLLIHGGSSGNSTYWRGAGELRATHGCIRLRNQDMKKLTNLLFEASFSEKDCQPVDVLVTVTDHLMSFMRPGN